MGESALDAVEGLVTGVTFGIASPIILPLVALAWIGRQLATLDD